MFNHPLSCEVTYDKTVNYATQQNHVPVIKKLTITNIEEDMYRNVKLKIEAEPEFCIVYESNIEVINPKDSIALGSVDLKLSPRFLGNLEEKISGFLRITLETSDKILLTEAFPIDILAFDEWNGFSVVPEIIAAFVTPNQKSVPKILKAASELLYKTTNNPSLGGYQSRNSQRVLNELASIYAALQSVNISYSSPPASFEKSGQKVRFPDTLMEHKLGTCLDTTLFYAACAEAIGINSLVIFSKGHSYVGFWLIDETFAECIQDDFTTLTKRLATGINEICIVETTFFTAGKDANFLSACEEAEKRLHSLEGFNFLVDIKRCRMSSIRPLPIRRREDNSLIIEDLEDINIDNSKSQELFNIDIVEDYSSSKTFEEKKLDEWQRKLLDLSLRNSLLNFRIGSAGIPIISPELPILEDALADGESFKILSKPEEWEVTVRDMETFSKRNDDNPIIKLLDEELDQKRLRSFLSQLELSTRLTLLYRSARTTMEENGANTLYLAMGFLVWFETEASEKPRYAPIILDPVDMIRKSVQSGYSIRNREEEAQINITLIEMLKQDFGIDASSLYPLPRDEHGIDVKKVFTKLRKIIMHMPKWDVVDQCHLGLFSFSKFVMWNDLKVRSNELKKNKVVGSLMTGRLNWTPEEIITDDLDRKYEPKNIFCPISADSSQLNAIVSAADNKSFVLHGPPGTGKSQTITNIIANALGNGKTVLFVAEKMAALSVVQKRLSQIGLESFCLELYSNKAKKKDVLEQLRKASEVTRINSPESFNTESDKIADIRHKLNSYIELLHKDRSIGHSIYDGISQYTSLNGVHTSIVFEASKIKNISKETFEHYKEIAHKLAVAAKNCDEPHTNPYLGIEKEDYSVTLKEQVLQLSKELIEYIEILEAIVEDTEKVLGFKFSLSSYKAFNLILQLCENLIICPEIDYKVLLSSSLKGLKDEINSLAVIGQSRDNYRKDILNFFDESVLKLDTKTLLGEIRTANDKWFLPKLLGQSKVLKTLAGYTKQGIKLDRGNLQGQIELMDQVNTLQRKLDSASEELKSYFSLQWNNSFSNWEELKKVCDYSITISKTAKAISSSLDMDFEEVIAKIVLVMENGIEDGNKSYKSLKSYSDTMKHIDMLWNKLQGKLTISYKIYIREETSEAFILNLKEKANIFIDGIEGLRDYCYYVRCKNKALETELSNLVKPLMDGTINSQLLEDAFLRGFYRVWIENETLEEKQLSDFVKSDFEDMIQRFNELDDNFAYLTQMEIYARLSSKVPNMTQETIASSEPGILQRAIRSQGRGLSIRKLFDSIPNLLARLTPCLLMSPISVAQYLDPTFPQFDLIVFDEASQMPTCEAIGAMTRGKDVIVVGDPNQLPPTSFFSSTQSSSEDDEVSMMDMESILDDCLSLNLPQLHLLWHYRSKHESLIAFSNKEYYDNTLITFPSSDDLVSKVRLNYVNGIYDRGKTKYNKKEAEAVVEEIFSRLNNPLECTKTIGVVTFNTIQQGVIQDMIDERLTKFPELEKYFNDEAQEPIFVKNLENVQGDERDVILFSIGYGPDKEGKIAMNFGPLNRDGGWRRLNVAVSRSRYEMMVFSSLNAADINLSRTNAKGVIGLRDFLEYAQKGRKLVTLAKHIHNEGLRYQSEIAKALRERGYKVSENIGSSDYKIDLAISHPEDSNKFILGIQCDGSSYAKAKTARDREKLRELVLKQLGWNIIKVWAMDYFENQAKEIVRIESEIKRVLKGLKTVTIFKQPMIQTFKPDPINNIELISSEYQAVSEVPIKKRSAEDIQPLEYIDVMIDILEQAMSLLEADLIKETAKRFGYQRMTAAIDTAIKNSICNAIERGIIEKKDNGSYMRS